MQKRGKAPKKKEEEERRVKAKKKRGEEDTKIRYFILNLLCFYLISSKRIF